MLKDKNGLEVREGDWLVDVDDSIWEVRKTVAGESGLTRLLEVFLFADGETYLLNGERWLTSKEISKMERIWAVA